jgi:hypothetical protein
MKNSKKLRDAGDIRLKQVEPVLAHLHHNLKNFNGLPVEVSWSAKIKNRRVTLRDVTSSYVPALDITISVNNYGDKIYAHKLHQHISTLFKILLPLDLNPYDQVKYCIPSR